MRWEAFGVGVLIAGCATPEHVQWGSEASAEARVAAPASAPVATGAPAPRVETRRRPSVGLRIDRALAAFHSRRAVAKSLPKGSSQHAEMWEDVLAQIDAACLDEPSAADLGAFVRARATLEVELDSDQRRGVALPKDLAQRVQRTVAFVDQGVHELRLASAPGTLLPVPRLRDGDVVLRAPVTPMVVSSPFGVRWDPIDDARRFHAGVDLGAPEGTMVYAAASGVVVYAGWQGGFGRHVVVDHGEGVRTHYSHMSELFVKPGQIVEEGDTVGGVGSTGRSTGPHLHFAVTTADGRFHDPMKLIDVPLTAALGQPVAQIGTQSIDFDKVELAAPVENRMASRGR